MGKRIEALLLAAAMVIMSAVCACAVKMDGKKTDDNYNETYLTFFGSTAKSGCNIRNVLCYMQTSGNTMYIVTDIVFDGGLSADNTKAGVIFYIDGAAIKADITGSKYKDAEDFDSDKFDYDYVSLYRRPDSLSIETRILFKDGISDPQNFNVQFIDDEGVKSAKCSVRYSAGEEYTKSTTKSVTSAGETAKETGTKATTTKVTTTKQPKTTNAFAASSAAKAKTAAPAQRNVFRASAKSTEASSAAVKSSSALSTKFRAQKTTAEAAVVYKTETRVTDRDDRDRDSDTKSGPSGTAHTDEYTTSASAAGTNPKLRQIIAAALGILIVAAVCVFATPIRHRNNSDKENK